MIRLDSVSHLHGEVITEHAFPEEYDSFKGGLASLTIPLRPVDGFSSSSRPLRPKRHVRSIGGQRKPFLLPVDQAAMNEAIDTAMRIDGWTSQPIASGGFASNAPLGLKGDFVRNSVFVEVEFGNAASLFRDLFKFQIANRARTGEVAVLVVATERFAKFFDSGVATLEGAQRLLPFMALGIQMPIWIVGIEPTDFAAIGDRYEEMRELCAQNGVPCHDFETALGASVPMDESLIAIPPLTDDLD
jgi:hypothetical protein